MTVCRFNAPVWRFGGTVRLVVWRAALGEAARFIFAPGRRGEDSTGVADEDVVQDEPAAGESARDAREADIAQIAGALREIVSELKEVNISLRAIARSQAQQATTQKRPQKP